MLPSAAACLNCGGFGVSSTLRFAAISGCRVALLLPIDRDQVVEKRCVPETLIHLTNVGAEGEGRVVVTEPIGELASALAAVVDQAPRGLAEHVERAPLRPVDPRRLDRRSQGSAAQS